MTQDRTTENTGRSRPRSLIAAAALLLLAVPVSTWWLVGDLSDPEIVDPDYFIRPPDIGATADLAIGITAIALAVASVRALAQATQADRMDARWWTVLLLLSIAGAGLGFAWRVFTAAVIGAPIGAGMIIMLGGPVLLILVMGAALLGLRTLRHPRGGDSS